MDKGEDEEMIIAIDFDGTCVTHEYPYIGKDIGAVPVLKSWVERGHKLILWTMRSGRGFRPIEETAPIGSYLPWSKELREAVDWFYGNNIPLFGINENPEQSWSQSPKAFANLYIDDAALGIPLIRDLRISDRPFVDWINVREMVRIIDAGCGLIGHM